MFRPRKDGKAGLAAGVLSDGAKHKVRPLDFGELLDLTVESLQSSERKIWLAERHYWNRTLWLVSRALGKQQKTLGKEETAKKK